VRRLATLGGTTALSRRARATRALSAARVGTLADGSVVGEGVDDGRDAGIVGDGAGAGAVPCGDEQATTTSTTAAIFMRQSFAVAHTASIARTSGRKDRMKVVTIANIGELNAFTSRRGFLRLMGAGGALVLLPGLFTACEDKSNTGGIAGPGSGSALTIDFAKGDVAIMQFAYMLEQLEAAFYTGVVDNFSASDIPLAEQEVFVDIRNHEVLHSRFLREVLGENGFTVAPIFGATNFTKRASILASAKDVEDLGIAAYNGAAQYLTSASNLLIAAKIVSVEGRHAAAIGDLIAPLGSNFAPTSFDNAFSLTKVAFATQPYMENRLEYESTPTAFVPGPI